MKLIKKYTHLIMLTTIVFSLLIVGVRVYGAVVNESTGAEKAYSSGGSCPHCSWHFSGDYGSGIRLGLYKYDGNGNPIKCGESIDLLNTAKTIESGSLITSGYSRFDYTHGDQKVLFYNGYVKVGDSKSNIRAESVDKYNGGKSYSLTVKNSSDDPWGTTFIKNFSNYLGNSYEEVNTKIKEIFKYYDFSEEEAGKYYITVEPTMTVYSRNHGNQKVYGTGYEIISQIDIWQNKEYTYSEVQWDIKGDNTCDCSTCKANEDNTVCTAKGLDFIVSQGNTMRRHVFNAMYVRQDEAKLFAQDGRYDGYNFINENGTGLITPETKAVPEWRAWSKTYAKEDYLKDKSGYGITVLWMQDIVNDDECVGEFCRNCKNYCTGLEGDALNQCAKEYCDTNEPNNGDCILECKDVVYDSPGCDREYLNVCYNGDLKTSDIKSEGNYCAADGETSDKTLTSKICYDDVDTSTNYKTESLFIGKGTNNVYVTETSKTASISYYKIECDEEIKFTNLPARTTVHVSSSLTANLYAGYTMDYSKVCQIYYKTSDEKWTTDYSMSRVADEIKKYSNRSTKKEDKGYIQIAEELIAKEKEEIKELEKKTNRTATEESKLKTLKEDVARLEGVITTLTEVVNDLKTIKSTAEDRLKSVKDKDQGSSGLTNQIELEVSNESASSSTTHNIALVPVYCIANNDTTTEKYCDLETYKEYTVNTSTNNVTCLDKNGLTIKADVENGTSTYTEKVYYSLPSSYTGINEVGATVVCHSKACTEGLTSPIEIPSAWVFDPLSESVSIDAYNKATDHNDLKLTVKGMGSCGQFSYELNCGYDFESSKLCTDECIGKYNDPNSEMTEEEYQACFQKYCSCDSYCGSNVACRMKYCPQECEGCEDLDITENSCSENSCVDACNKTYADHNDRLTCRYGCCRTGCNGEEGCIYNCCKSECDIKRKNNYITADEYNLCIKMCDCENGSCPPDDSSGRDYIYRTINLKRPFPNGDNPDGRTPGANWFGKVEYITSSSDTTTKYYDATDGVSEEYEYRFFLSSEKIKEIKANEELDLTYTEFKESKEARNIYEDATKTKPENQRANVYCSYVIHDYFKGIGIEATSNAKDVDNKYVVGSGCYTR